MWPQFRLSLGTLDRSRPQFAQCCRIVCQIRAMLTTLCPESTQTGASSAEYGAIWASIRPGLDLLCGDNNILNNNPHGPPRRWKKNLPRRRCLTDEANTPSSVRQTRTAAMGVTHLRHTTGKNVHGLGSPGRSRTERVASRLCRVKRRRWRRFS